MSDLQIKIESLQNMLVDKATGGSGDDVEYKKLRTELLGTTEIKSITVLFGNKSKYQSILAVCKI